MLDLLVIAHGALRDKSSRREQSVRGITLGSRPSARFAALERPLSGESLTQVGARMREETSAPSALSAPMRM